MLAAGPGARAFALLLTASLIVSGCSLFGPEFHLAEDAPKSAALRRVALLPMNFDQSPRPSLAPGTELMGERIRQYLEARGYEVVTPAMSTTLALWRECTREVGGLVDESGKKLDEERYERAQSQLVRRTLEAFPADGVVSATVVLRKARYAGKNLVWDGVSRPVPIDVGKTNIAVRRLQGSDLGISLRTRVFDQQGRKFFERYVGLEGLHHYGPMGRLERTDLFQDESLLEQGVELSFEPWLQVATK
jgi:hypothetical protein